MSKGEQLQRAVEWIIANDMEDSFCTICLHNGMPVISFLRLHDMINTLRGCIADVRGSSFGSLKEYEVRHDGFLFVCSSSDGVNKPGQYRLDGSILKAEWVA